MKFLRVLILSLTLVSFTASAQDTTGGTPPVEPGMPGAPTDQGMSAPPAGEAEAPIAEPEKPAPRKKAGKKKKNKNKAKKKGHHASKKKKNKKKRNHA